jgi:hypothetical protein
MENYSWPSYKKTDAEIGNIALKISMNNTALATTRNRNYCASTRRLIKKYLYKVS